MKGRKAMTKEKHFLKLMQEKKLEAKRILRSIARHWFKIHKNHGNSSFSELKDFIKECGNKHNYKAIKVFHWLGY